VIRFPVKWHYNKIKCLINIIHVFRPAPLDFIKGTTKEVNILITINNNQKAMLLHILLIIYKLINFKIFNCKSSCQFLTFHRINCQSSLEPKINLHTKLISTLLLKLA